MKKTLVVVSSLILSLALILGVGMFSLKIYVDNNVDYSVDDALFEAAKSSNSVTYVAYDRNGKEEIVWRGSSGGRKTWVSLDEIPDALKNGFIAMEDRSFYSHSGIDLKRTLGAVVNYFTHSKPNFGASTITQQVIKNISGDNDYSVKRKINEIFRALHLEMTRSKDEILELYLNIVPMSGNIYGVREAAVTFFGKDVSDLTVAEAATIIGITNSPARYDPYKNKLACTEKRNRVLGAMLECAVIEESTYNSAVSEELVTATESAPHGGVASWFVETANEDIISDLKSTYGVSESAANMLLNGGTKVVLTVDTQIQKILEEYFEDTANLPGAVGDGLQYAMVVCDSQSGNLLGVIGRAGEKKGNKLLNLALTPHPPASALKPLALYAPLIDEGSITWSTIFDDAPLSSEEVDGEIIQYPKNSPDIYEGGMTVSDALKKSKNTVALSLYEMLGGNKIFDILSRKYGFNTLVKEEASSNGSKLTDIAPAPLAMGQLTYGVSLRKLTSAYTVFPSSGILRANKSYYGVFGSDGKVLLESDTKEERVMEKNTAGVMNRLLSGVVEDGTAKSITLKELVDTAGKTGTSGGNLDKLFVGYTPYYTAGIWCGYPDGNTAIGALSPNHIEIWDALMKEIHEATAFKNSGENIIGFDNGGAVQLLYCTASGMLATDVCKERGRALYGYYKRGSVPSAECDIHTFTDN